MQHTGGRVFASTAAFAGAAGIVYDLTWAILWIAIVIALFDTVFQLIRAIGEGPARGARRAPVKRPPAEQAIDLR